MSNTAAVATLGQHVLYVSTKGHQKLGLVVATSDSLTEGSEFTERFPLSSDQVNLLVFNPVGVPSPRVQVPAYASVEDNADFAKGGYFLPLGTDYVAPAKVKADEEIDVEADEIF